MQTATTDPLVGRSLEARYRILDPIARGGMSTVYAAVDERLDRLVAVKVMSSALSADPAFSDRFAREARAAARLTHLNVVSVYDQGHEVGPDGHHVFLVMELVEGRTLRELLRERGRLNPAEAVSIMEPVLSALSAAHRAGLVHRDVKPENILLSDDGVVKVADFGLAHAVESDASSTRTGLMMGTVAYTAPEQISKGMADPRSDVYSAGIVLFELLTGEPPYRGETAMNIAYQHVHSRVPAPSSRARGVPDEIDEIVVAATDSDPTSRPSDAGAFLAELSDVRGDLGLPVIPVPPRPRDRVRRSVPPARNRTPDSATTAAVRAQAGRHDTTLDPAHQRPNGMARPVDQPDRRRHPRDDDGPPPPVVIPPQRRRRRRRGRILAILIVLVLLGAAAGWAGWYFASGRYSRVPDLRGASPSAAVSKLENAGYRVEVEPGQVYDEKVPPGEVVRTDPGANTRAVRGTRVSVTISKGAHYYPVKPVAGKSLDAARQILLSAGRITIATSVRREYSDKVGDNLVTRTDPQAGSQVRADQPVIIYVSRGPPVVDVPTISQGTALEDAKSRLRDAHLKYSVEEQYSDTVDKGTVVSVSPSDRARKFSRVTLVVSRGPEMVRVPEIAQGTPVAAAKKTLTDAGLVPDVKTVADAGAPGVVLAISPAAGSTVHSGSTVLVVALPA